MLSSTFHVHAIIIYHVDATKIFVRDQQAINDQAGGRDSESGTVYVYVITEEKLGCLRKKITAFSTFFYCLEASGSSHCHLLLIVRVCSSFL